MNVIIARQKTLSPSYLLCNMNVIIARQKTLSPSYLPNV